VSEHELHPRSRPLRPREREPRFPRIPRSGPRQNHPSWRGRYVHAPRYGTRGPQVIVKTTWHPKGQRGFHSMTATTAAHIRYLRKEHDVGSEIDRAVYTQEQDRLSPEERTAFTTRTRDDRWQWHLVISPGQVKDEDLRQLTRNLMGQIEKDTGYTLDWVAANHYNTAHPHSHVILRGKDVYEQDVGLKRDYLQRGIPYRAQDLATEQLEQRRLLEHDYAQQRTMEVARTSQPQRQLDYEQERGR
jgi:type IV secretory pathway VirD2 relaxase